jgi:OOP family OmpA-OmpF porin
MTTRHLAIAVIGVVALASAGCATKRHVRNTVAPLEGRVGDVEKKTATHDTAIGELENGVSRADERAKGAEAKATEASGRASLAQEAAVKAGDAATLADRMARESRALAEKGIDQNTVLVNRIEGLDNYRLATGESVTFAFNQAVLSKEAKEKLDALARNAVSMKRCVIEVRGFTDTTGPADYNLELSRKRAGAVVRYLTMTHDVPLFRVHVLGAGSEKLLNTGHTRAARSENRRVEIKIYTPTS